MPNQISASFRLTAPYFSSAIHYLTHENFKKHMHLPSKYLIFNLPYFLFVFLSLSLSLCLQGRCVISVQLTDEELVADDKGVDYFLLFAGSTQRHLTSTLRNNHDTLHALCPGMPHFPQFPAALTTTADKCVGRQLHLQCFNACSNWNFLITCLG